ncbi:dynein light chain, cytosolic [Melanomma pulvis-pyrius CBS 109.77]|uniref:Dynein light chain, cytosolic n=1 Tax=Melanomma pulvis-pyrius CBS 109.77 TaxID=1314802 RepID=A0A6A6XEE5_9PLEO|nr:dynein light chain, cytosolic [Melanomma pulvis-pyrius CBS 109.77]
MASPLPTEELAQIAKSACETALGSVQKYEHASVTEWNTQIINTILQSLIEKTSTGEDKVPGYKYITNSTIIQHIGSPSESQASGRRGMHSAVGAYWNNEKDGTYSYKWEGAEKIGMDIVISITWIAL